MNIDRVVPRVSSLVSATRAALTAGRWLAAARWCALVSLVVPPGIAAAQGLVREPPGPYVVDLRGTTIGVPQSAGFYPALPEGTLVPARGFGVEAGGHVYLMPVGPGRLGVGASVIEARATADDVSARTRMLAPQVSINFGTSLGWSYISGGVGVAQIRGRSDEATDGDTTAGGTRMAVNLGGGARWFFTPRLAIGFDLRLHRIGAGGSDAIAAGTPASFLGSAAVGFSVR